MAKTEADGWIGRIILSAIGVLLTVVSALAIQTGANTNRALDELRLAVSGLTTKLAVLETKIEKLPPESLVFRISILEAKTLEFETEIKDLQKRMR